MKLLNKIQQQLKAPKSQYNSFGKYNFRNCEDILEAVKPLLGTGTLLLSDEVICVGGKNYVKATATIKDGDENESVSAYARESVDFKGMADAQMTGSASSYARKYALNGLFVLDDTKDADSQDNSKTKPSEKSVVSLKQRVADALAHEALGEMKTLDSGDSYKAYCLAKTGLELTEKNFDAILKALNK